MNPYLEMIKRAEKEERKVIRKRGEIRAIDLFYTLCIVICVCGLPILLAELFKRII